MRLSGQVALIFAGQKLRLGIELANLSRAGLGESHLLRLVYHAFEKPERQQARGLHHLVDVEASSHPPTVW